MLPSLNPAVEWLEENFNTAQATRRSWISQYPLHEQGLESKTMVWAPWIFNFRYDPDKGDISPDWYVWTKGTPVVGDYSKLPLTEDEIWTMKV